MDHCRGLAAFLKDSPHLAARVCSLFVTLNVEIFTLLATMELPNLRYIHIGAGEADIMDDGVAELVQAAVARPSIRHLRMTDMGFFSDVLATILRSNGHLQGLHFGRCAAIHDQLTNVSERSQRAMITHLSVARCSPSLAKLLKDPGLPLDFSKLVYANVLNSATTHLSEFLGAVRESVKWLTFGPDDVNDEVDDLGDLDADSAIYRSIEPMRFPAVTRLTLNVWSSKSIAESLPIFSGLPPQNYIQDITYVVMGRVSRGPTWDRAKALAAAFDPGFAALPLPALERVEIRFSAALDVEDQVSMYREAFPLLNARELLFFSSY
ncbi:hypothetical protein DFH08DRAFT_1086562 [Mycena albidolilacea]|uniref:Uncharacterized protein n=1 Tax=Mycena albidolilacea TaxID=1033008 RepID=A0AAD6ZEK5_9AGAR|nr:hypothetical protein DFH08DRAFT_1086562 [Mycena albidolilacea]